MTVWDEMVVVGRIARAQGNRGQVIVDPVTDFPEERFKAGSVLQIQRNNSIESLTIEDARFHRGRPVIQLTGIETMNAAEALAGTELRVPTDALQALPPGSYYHHELIGCAVTTEDGRAIGEVASVDGGSTGSLLVVTPAPSERGESRGEILIPLVEGICVSVDIPGRKIVVEPPDGLLELNVTRRQRF